MLLQQLDLSKVDVNMFGAANNSLINDGCGLFRGRQNPCLTSICPGSRAIRLIRTDAKRKGREIFFWSVRTFHGQASVWIGLRKSASVRHQSVKSRTHA